MLKFLTLHQPWATLMALGEKTIETRKWRTTYRGPLGIIAGRDRRFLPLCLEEPFRSILTAQGYETPETLEIGQILCVVTLEDCVRTEMIVLAPEQYGAAPHEVAFGNYANGHWGWLTHTRMRLVPGLPAVGRLGVQKDPDLASRVRRVCPSLVEQETP
jgi:hypothetical protein